MKTARTRKRRRLAKARVRTGKQIVRHKCKKGRTGKAHAKVTRPKISVHSITFHRVLTLSVTLYRIEK